MHSTNFVPNPTTNLVPRDASVCPGKSLGHQRIAADFTAAISGKALTLYCMHLLERFCSAALRMYESCSRISERCIQNPKRELRIESSRITPYQP